MEPVQGAASWTVDRGAILNRADGIAFVYDFRPDRADYTGYSAVTDSFVGPIIEHLPEGYAHRVREPVEGMLNVRFYTWPAPQEHVFISHGIADKAYRTPSKLFGFAHVHSSGPWWTRYYTLRGPEDMGSRVFESGYTKLDPLFDGRIPREPASDGRVRVLWAPTHSGVNGQSRNYPSSYLELSKSIETLLPASEFSVEIAPHPRLREAQRLPIKVTMEEYARCDVVVADAGSTLYEAWALGLPVVFPDWIVDHKIAKRQRTSTLEGVIYAQGLGYHAMTPGALADTVRMAARDGMGEREASLIEDVFPARYRGNSGERTAAALLEIAASYRPALTSSDFMWVTSEDGTRSEHVTRKAYRAVWMHKGYRPSAEVLTGPLPPLVVPGKG